MLPFWLGTRSAFGYSSVVNGCCLFVCVCLLVYRVAVWQWIAMTVPRLAEWQTLFTPTSLTMSRKTQLTTWHTTQLADCHRCMRAFQASSKPGKVKRQTAPTSYFSSMNNNNKHCWSFLNVCVLIARLTCVFWYYKQHAYAYTLKYACAQVDCWSSLFSSLFSFLNVSVSFLFFSVAVFLMVTILLVKFFFSVKSQAFVSVCASVEVWFCSFSGCFVGCQMELPWWLFSMLYYCCILCSQTAV